MRNPPPDQLAPTDAAPPCSLRPTRARYWVIVFAAALAIIQYVDKVCMSQAAPFVQQDLHLNPEQMGWVFGAFTLAYALFEIPAGYLGDRFGPRKILLRIVIWWSCFTAAIGRMWSWGSLVAVQFLFGAGEAGAFPNLTKAFNRWLPTAERSRAQGIMWMSARLGGAFTPMLVYLCLKHVTWRTAFLLFGVPGVIWAVLFFLWYREDPRTHPQVNAAEAALLPVEDGTAEHFKAPWKALFTSRTVWCLCGQYFACSYSFWFFITWFPTYLLKARGFDLKQSALLAGTPLIRGGDGIAARGLALADPQPAGWERCQRAAGRWGGGCLGRGRPACGGDQVDPALPGGRGHRPRRLLQRYPNARRVDCLHGRGRQSRGHPVRHHEHDGQRRRVCLPHSLRLHR